ncbi:MAG: ribosomal RNA small subunit methyltransferase A [Clostridia bacterium]|nr:ribosomal RNA small subunit methyltransferase A [Clostridia bacterium]
MNLYSSKEMTLLLERHDFFFKKNLGQNFLMNEATALRIATAARETVTEDGPVLALEIGPGAGSLTLQLSKLFDRVHALEIDPHLLGVLEESLKDCENVTVENCDALQFDYQSLLTRYPNHHITVCSNLPYYITSEVIMLLLESGIPLTGITVLIQKEACTRFTAAPATPDYGAISAATAYRATAKKLFQVGPGNFIPRPKVDSAVLRLIPRKEKAVQVENEALFFKIIRAAFSARRKTLLNALTGGGIGEKERLEALLTECEIDPARRGETLSLDEFARIANILNKTEES